MLTAISLLLLRWRVALNALLMLKPLPREPAGFSLGLWYSKKEVRYSQMLDFLCVFSTLTNVNPERRNLGFSFTLNIAPTASERTALVYLPALSLLFQHTCVHFDLDSFKVFKRLDLLYRRRFLRWGWNWHPRRQRVFIFLIKCLRGY